MLDINNDKAIEFEAIRYKVNKNLNRLKKIGLRVKKFEDLMKAIIEQCHNDISYPVTGIFEEGYVKNGYINAIEKLESLQFELLKYDIYFKVEAFSKVLQDFLSSLHPSESEIIKIRERLLSTLDLVKNSNTLDYEVEGPLIEEFYSFTYAFIKLELEVFGSSVTLNELKKNEIHELHLDKQIEKELETFDLKDKRASLVVTEKNKIDANGMNATYVEEDFIKSIIGTPKSEEEIHEKVDTLSIKMDEYYQKINKIKENVMTLKNLQAKLKEDHAYVKKYIRKDIALFCTSFGLIASFLTASICGSLAASKEKVYKQIVHTYTTDSGLETEEKEVTEITNRITLNTLLMKKTYYMMAFIERQPLMI